MRGRLAVLVAAVLLLAGCDWPRDAGRTLDDVRGGVLRVGITENEPWTEVADDGSVTGAEVTLVERLATDLGARIEWHPGSESTLMEALKHRVLDLVIGGLTDTAPWTKEASLTRPFVTTRTVVAIRAGVSEPVDLQGVRVAVRAGTAEVAALLSEDAVPVPVADVTEDQGLPVVVDEWQLGPLDLRATRHDLTEHNHVWAVGLGENGWQATVERHLLGLTRAEVLRLLSEAERVAS